MKAPRWGASAFFAVALVFLLPLLTVAVWSCVASWPWPSLVPATFSARAWDLVLDPDNRVLAAATTSGLLASGTTAMTLLLALPLAQRLAQTGTRGRTWVRVVAFMPLLVPGFVAALGLHDAFLRAGLTDHWFGVMLILMVPALPYMTWMLMVGFMLNGTRVEAAARTLGANPRQVFRHVTWPRLKPAVLTGAFFTFLVASGDYVLTWLVGGGEVVTLPLVLYPFVAAGDRAASGAVAVIMGLLAPAVYGLVDGLWRVAGAWRWPGHARKRLGRDYGEGAPEALAKERAT